MHPLEWMRRRQQSLDQPCRHYQPLQRHQRHRSQRFIRQVQRWRIRCAHNDLNIGLTSKELVSEVVTFILYSLYKKHQKTDEMTLFWWFPSRDIRVFAAFVTFPFHSVWRWCSLLVFVEHTTQEELFKGRMRSLLDQAGWGGVKILKTQYSEESQPKCE